MIETTTSTPSMPQKLKETFNKKLKTSLAYQKFGSQETINSIISKGSKGNQLIFSRKTTQSTYVQLQFQNQEDYFRQKLLIMTLNTIGKYDENQEFAELEQSINEYPNAWKFLNPRYPYLSGFNDQELQMEMQIGMASLTSFRRYRQDKNIAWQDKEIQFLMKSLCKIVTELYNCGLYHGDICPDHIYFRKNLLDGYEPILTDYCDLTNNYQKINGFNPDFQNYLNQEINIFANKESRLQQELYQVGRVIQKCMLDIKSKHEENLFSNQTNIGIDRCLQYFKCQKSSQFSNKTIECLEILLKKGNLENLIKKFKKFNKQQMIVDNEKIIDSIFNNMCIIHPPLKTIKKVTQKPYSDNNSTNTSFISTTESEHEEEQKKQISVKNLSDQIYQEQQLQFTLQKMKLKQDQQEKKQRKYSDNPNNNINTLINTSADNSQKNLEILKNANISEQQEQVKQSKSDQQQNIHNIQQQLTDSNNNISNDNINQLKQQQYQQEKKLEKIQIDNDNDNENDNDNDNDSDWDIVSFQQNNSCSSFEEL